jgi:hypothetical protein
MATGMAEADESVLPLVKKLLARPESKEQR